MAKQIIVSHDGFLKLQNELEYLKTVKRKEVAQAIQKAREYGDLSENSEYDEAKNEQAKIEAQIADLEETIATARVIGDHEIQTDVVSVGVSVLIYDFEFEEEVEYTLVSSREVDPLNNKISDQSPIGKALIGAKVGDTITVEVPDGTAKFEIRSIEKKAH